jgi:PadR family transcriptional regulator PadR
MGKGCVVRKDKLELLQGTLDMLVLKTLTAGPLHGYNIVDRIQQSSSDVIKVEEGSLYPALHRMERRGWILSDWGYSENNRRAKFYRLTRSGRKQLESELFTWARISQAITSVINGSHALA